MEEVYGNEWKSFILRTCDDSQVVIHTAVIYSQHPTPQTLQSFEKGDLTPPHTWKN